MTGNVEIVIKIPKRYYDIAMKIDGLPEVQEIKGLNYIGGTVKEQIKYAEISDRFQEKVKTLFKAHGIKTVNQRKAVQRARDAIHLDMIVEG